MSNYIISFETEEASFTIRFEAEGQYQADAIAAHYMQLLAGKGKVFITEALTENINAA